MDLTDYAQKTRETAVYPGSNKEKFAFSRTLEAEGKKWVPAEEAEEEIRRLRSTIGLNYTLLGLGNESGEVLGKLKKMYRDDGGVLTHDRQEAMVDELGDVLWYFARACEELGVDPANVAYRNIAKLRDRAARGTLQGSGDKR
jgi:NTP pyrophosphatase (non-canonical NTP hydrolase)